MSCDHRPNSRREKAEPLMLTTIELAEMLRLSPRTLQNMRVMKRGPAYLRIGRKGKSVVRYLRSDVISWLRQWRIEPVDVRDRKSRVAGEFRVSAQALEDFGRSLYAEGLEAEASNILSPREAMAAWGLHYSGHPREMRNLP